MAETKCVCSHVEAEHSQSGECQIDWCLCGYWNPADSPGRGKSRYGESMEFSDDYIELCRKLALPREWRPGDIYAASQGAGYELPTREVELVGVGAWLPREGDLLDLLEAEGAYPVLLVSLRPAKDGSGYGIDTAEGDDGDCYFGPDRLMALAKLYAAAHDIDLPAPAGREKSRG